MDRGHRVRRGLPQPRPRYRRLQRGPRILWLPHAYLTVRPPAAQPPQVGGDHVAVRLPTGGSDLVEVAVERDSVYRPIGSEMPAGPGRTGDPTGHRHRND